MIFTLIEITILLKLGDLKMHPIKTIYNFIVTFQILALIVFMFYLFENNLDITIPISINFVIPINFLPDIIIDFYYEFHFNVGTILSMIVGMFLVYLITSINVVDSGLTDTGTISVKQIISFFAKYLVLNLPIIFLFSQSSILINYVTIISIAILVIYFLNLMIDSGEEKI